MQNNMKELFGIMNLLNRWEWCDEVEFFEQYGGDTEVSTVEQIQALQVLQFCLISSSFQKFFVNYMAGIPACYADMLPRGLTVKGMSRSYGMSICRQSLASRQKTSSEN